MLLRARGIRVQEIIIYIELIIYEMVVGIIIEFVSACSTSEAYRINIIKFSRIMRSDLHIRHYCVVCSTLCYSLIVYIVYMYNNIHKYGHVSSWLMFSALVECRLSSSTRSNADSSISRNNINTYAVDAITYSVVSTTC